MTYPLSPPPPFFLCLFRFSFDFFYTVSALFRLLSNPDSVPPPPGRNHLVMQPAVQGTLQRFPHFLFFLVFLPPGCATGIFFSPLDFNGFCSLRWFLSMSFRFPYTKFFFLRHASSFTANPSPISSTVRLIFFVFLFLLNPSRHGIV